MAIAKFKKSQAALEFLTTYGWAFLVILIMVSTLAYFGVLNPSKVLPNRCTFGAEFSCVDYKLGGATVDLRLKSNIADPITVTGISFAKEDGTAITCTTNPAWGTFTLGQTRDLAFSVCNGALASGQKSKILVTVSYYATSSGVNYGKQVLGEIYSQVA